MKIKNLFESGLPRKKDYIEFYFGEEMRYLTDQQIINFANEYEIKFEKLCVNMAKKLKHLIITEYGIVQGLKKVPLRSIFSFDLGTKIRKVKKRENIVITEYVLNKIKGEIENYRETKDSLVDYHKENYEKIFSFIKKHLEFTRFINFKITGKFKISDIKISDDQRLVLRSWLFENLRYAFPTKYGISLDNNLLSRFLFNDCPGYGEQSIVNSKLMSSELYKRFELRELLGIDYRVSKLTIQDFKMNKIVIDQFDLDYLKQQICYLIYEYILREEHIKPYVSEVTGYGIEVGREFWTPEYFVIRSIFFVAAESNGSYIEDFKTIGDQSGVKKPQRYLRSGYGFGETYLDLLEYVKNLYYNRSNDSDQKIFKDALRILKDYDKLYYLRSKAQGTFLGDYDSDFERNVHHFLVNEINPLFIHHVPIVDLIGKRRIVLKDIHSNRISKKIHYAFHYDFYLELNDELRRTFTLSDRWKGIAVEAQGSYWHGQDHPAVIKRDEFKRRLSISENIIIIEIWDSVSQNEWLNEFMRQMSEQNELKNLSK